MNLDRVCYQFKGFFGGNLANFNGFGVVFSQINDFERVFLQINGFSGGILALLVVFGWGVFDI